VFFVISGYLITTLMLREHEGTGGVSVRQFYIRRAWRILPVAYAYLTVITLAQHAQFSWRDIGLCWGYMASWASYFGTLPWNLNHLWSLSVEEQFYLAWPLIFALSIRWAKRAAWAAVVMAPLCRYWFGHHELSLMALWSFPAVVDSIATGCLMALYSRPLVRLVANRRWLGFAWLVAVILPALGAVGDHTRFLWPLPQLFGHSVWTLFNVCVGAGNLWAIAAQPKVLNHWLPVWVGTLSYSLYIWQMPFMNPQANIRFPINLVLVFTAAAASYYLLEQPMLRLRGRLRHRQGAVAQGS
jgi:peptidoglycan/LPS O-acetylase OafA/YrhL